MSNTNSVATVRTHLRSAIVALMAADTHDSLKASAFLKSEAEKLMQAAQAAAELWDEGEFEIMFEIVYDAFKRNDIEDAPKTPDEFWKTWNLISDHIYAATKGL